MRKGTVQLRMSRRDSNTNGGRLAGDIINLKKYIAFFLVSYQFDNDGFPKTERGSTGLRVTFD